MGLPETAFVPRRVAFQEAALQSHSQIDPRQGLIGWSDNLCEIHDCISSKCHYKQIEKQNKPSMLLVHAYAANSWLHFHLQNHLALFAMGSLASCTVFLHKETSLWIPQWHSMHSAGHWSHHIRLRHITSVDVTDRTRHLMSQQGTSPSTASYKDTLSSKVK